MNRSKAWIRSLLAALVFAVAPALAGPAAAQAKAPTLVELNRREEAMVAAGYNLTHGFSLQKLSADQPIRLELFVPTAGEGHLFSFWADAVDGAIAFQLLAPDGKPIASWSGSRGELSVSQVSVPGKYLLQIERLPGTAGELSGKTNAANGEASSHANGHALLGIKGAALSRCTVREGELQEHAASSEHRFQFPYLLYLPTQAAALKSKQLVVLPINTGFATSDLDLLRASASCEIESSARMLKPLGVPLLIPLFPRPDLPGDENLYTHALSRASLETKVDSLRRLDLQLLAMIDDARAALRAQHVDLDARILLFGFSAAGSFAGRFAMLHPERVLALASGSPGGWPIAPLAEWEGEKLNYPVGIADLETLVGKAPDRAQLQQPTWLFLLGDQDENDSVPYRDSFSRPDEEQILRLFGKTPVSRWKAIEMLYTKAGLRARFILYPGASHSMTEAMERDVVKLFRESTPQSGH